MAFIILKADGKKFPVNTAHIALVVKPKLPATGSIIYFNIKDFTKVEDTVEDVVAALAVVDKVVEVTNDGQIRKILDKISANNPPKTPETTW